MEKIFVCQAVDAHYLSICGAYTQRTTQSLANAKQDAESEC